jgi:hypothetical protein
LSEKEFNAILLEATDEGLSSIGETPKQALYFLLEEKFNIKKQEIPHRIADFEDALERIFGPGAKFLEIIIMKCLYEKVGQTVHLCNPNDFSFTKYVKAVKHSYLEKNELRTRMGSVSASRLSYAHLCEEN